MGMYNSAFEDGITLPKSGDIPGLEYGVVVENGDKEHEGMVKVSYPLMENGQNVSGWAEVSTLYAGKNYGVVCMPEVSDNVLLGFPHNDLNHPIVLGSRYVKGDSIIGETVTEKNNLKCIYIKNGPKILADGTEKKSKLDILTPEGLRASLDDENQTIVLSDEQGSTKISLDMKNGTITLDAGKKLNFNVNGKTMLSFDGTAGNIKMEGNKVDINGSQAVNVKGGNTTISGTMLSAKGDSSVKVESSGMCQVSGTMVKIN